MAEANPPPPEGLAQRLQRRLRREAFVTGWLSVIINPFHVIRAGLYRAVAEAAPKIGGAVLDFGCGSKPYRSLFTKVDRYIGLDVAISGHDHHSSDVDVFYDGRTIPFPDNQFDAIVSFEVLEHVFDIDAILSEWRRVLRPGGKVLATLPFAWDEHELPFDFGRYTSFGIRHVFERRGFIVDAVEKNGNYVTAIGQMAIAYLVQHAFPRRGIGARIGQLLVICPLTVLTMLLGRILPFADTYFCNVIVKAHSENTPIDEPPIGRV